MLFNKENKGGTELTGLLGFLDKSTNFSIWKPWILLSVRVIKAAVGEALYAKAETHYLSDSYQVATPEVTGETPVGDTPEEPTYTNEQLDELVHKMQLANALFAYVRIIPTLDAGHSNSGRSRALGSDVKALTAIEAYKDESNIQSLGYEALEDLIQYAEKMKFTEWTEFLNKNKVSTLLIQSREVFDQYFRLDSARMFYALIPMLHDVQRNEIASRISDDQAAEMLTAEKADPETDETKKLVDVLTKYVRPVMVYGTLIKALNRLPVEIFPEGLLQTQIVGTVKEKKTATEEARKSMLASMKEDMELACKKLEDALSALNGTTETDVYVSVPHEMGKGFGF